VGGTGVGPNEVRAPESAERDLLERLRAGDEAAFEQLVRHHHATMITVARAYVRTRAAAEEVVQDAWLGVLAGIGRFEGRSSLRTWILSIVANKARTRGARESRSVPFSSLEHDTSGPAVDPDRFRGPDDGFHGHWRSYPRDWRSLPEEVMLGQETLSVVMRCIEELPIAQQAVIRMRDVEGWTAEEVCTALDLSPGNQRVLLHRARSRVRAALEGHLDG
jgi:RNA polymerase sigma-70 factor (ECF subfamily)